MWGFTDGEHEIRKPKHTWTDDDSEPVWITDTETRKVIAMILEIHEQEKGKFKSEFEPAHRKVAWQGKMRRKFVHSRRMKDLRARSTTRGNCFGKCNRRSETPYAQRVEGYLLGGWDTIVVHETLWSASRTSTLCDWDASARQWKWLDFQAMPRWWGMLVHRLDWVEECVRHVVIQIVWSWVESARVEN